MRESYTSNRIGLLARYREAKYLWTYHRSEAENRVNTLVGIAEQCSLTLNEAFGFEVSGRKILDVGPGQFLIQSRYFATRNEVVAIDMELIVEKLTPGNFLEMVRRNGMQRAIKTAARKASGVDRAYERALRKRLRTSVLPHVDLRRGDASGMPFSNESFDMIHSRSVLQFIDKPEKALSEIARVLKPGGVAHVDLHLYSSVTGSLDPRVLHGDDSKFHWAHLGSDTLVKEGSFLNKLRLTQWKGLFTGYWPGSRLSTVQVEDPALHQEANALLAHGRLAGYSKEELLTTTIVVIWQKGLSH